MPEDLIVAEVRKTRQRIFARFGYDLDAYFAHLQATAEDKRRRGVRYVDQPIGKIDARKSDAA
ncbi:hypothetical protein [Longimicrobium sp.]|uniref:hypothetical protein n=1 Tax=Longimicrobium sp. TaxID=2029185 RepID=UPI003B3AC0AE